MTSELHDAPPPYGTVVFDCDSTLSRIEGIDELGREQREQISALTNRAMNNELALEDVYAARLELIRPSRAAVARVAQQYFDEALPHAAELVAALRALNKRVVVVSGGLLPAVLDFALRLGIDASDVRAVDMQFDAVGEYAGFDDNSPLARSGGKPEVMAELASSSGAGALSLIGDGATDLEAAPNVARFIAFGGVVRREAVFAKALKQCEVADFAALVPLLFSASELERLHTDTDHAALWLAAQPYLS